jgi:hypothetical protein
MMRFTVSKLIKSRSDGGAAAIVTDQNGNVVCVAYETAYGYVFNDASNKASVGALSFQGGRATIAIPESASIEIKRKLFGRVKFPKKSIPALKKKGSMRRFKVSLFENGHLAARVQKNASDAYFLDVWKGTNALRAILIAVAMNDFFLRKKS